MILILIYIVSKTIQSYSEQLAELDQTIRRMIVESLGVEKYMNEHMNSTNYILRLMKYKPPQNNETETGLSAHTDKKSLTILYQDQVNGLQVLTKDGQWKNLDPTPNTFTVIVGDSLHVSSSNSMNDLFSSAFVFFIKLKKDR